MYRSRLTRLEDKRNLRTATLFTIGTIILIILAAVLGIPALVRLVVLISDLKSKGTPADKTDLIPPPPPQIILSYDATNSATQTITGLSEPGATIYVTQNAHQIGTVVATQDGTFEVDKVTLTPGDNLFEAVAVDQAGNKSQPAKQADMQYLTKPPQLQLNSPSDHQNVSGNPASVNVTGTTDANARLTVNGRVIIVDSQGAFSTTYNLNPGDNVLDFLTVDQAGNQTKKEVTVTYQP